jgi:hypothetical protein
MRAAICTTSDRARLKISAGILRSLTGEIIKTSLPRVQNAPGFGPAGTNP